MPYIQAQAHRPAAWIAAARAAVRERIFTTLGDAPYAGVITALVVGDQRSIPHDQWRAFTRTGVNHLLSISGLHVTMIAALAGWLVASIWRRLPRRVERLPARQAGLVAAVLAAFGYALLAGFQVPAQRTLFMLTVLSALGGTTNRTSLEVWPHFQVRLLPGQSDFVFSMYGTPGELEGLKQLVRVMREQPLAWRGKAGRGSLEHGIGLAFPGKLNQARNQLRLIFNAQGGCKQRQQAGGVRRALVGLQAADLRFAVTDGDGKLAL